MSIDQTFVSFAELERQGITLVDTLAARIYSHEVALALDREPERIERDGLGDFDFFGFSNPNIGYWALLGSRSYPEQGVSIWAEPQADEAVLIATVKGTIRSADCLLMRSGTGELVG